MASSPDTSTSAAQAAAVPTPATPSAQPKTGTSTGGSVEMDNLAAAGLTGAAPSLEPEQERERDTVAGAQQETDGSAEPSAPAAAAASSHQPAQDTNDTTNPLRQTPTATSTTNHPRDTLTRKETEALGPATEAPIAPPLPTAASGPALSITLMLITGARHPYKIDEKYLRNRKVEASALAGEGGTFDPRELSGYKLKELIWTDWRSEWEPRPASPSSIRLIILGRFVEDKAALKDLPFKMDDTNVVHMTVKPADFIDEEENIGKGTGKGHSIRGRDDGEGGAGCRCVIL